MAVFDFLKRRRDELPLPPPPSPPDMPTMLRGDFEPIQATDNEDHEEQLPELPLALPAPEPEEVMTRTPEVQAPIQREITRVPIKPIFIAVEDYKRIMNETNTVRTRLIDAENTIKKLNEIKTDEERTFEKWKEHLENIEKKLNYVDQLIAKAQ